MASDDFALLDAWRQGDTTAGETLVARYYHGVLRFFELRATRVADDLTQKTMLACVERRDFIRGDAGFKAFVFGTARRVLMRHLRDEHRFARMARFEAAGTRVTATSLSSIAARTEEQLLLLRALVCLPDDMQTAITLHYWEGMRSDDIGQVLEVSSSGVRSRLQRGRQALRDTIEQMAKPGGARAALLADIDGWTRSMAVPAPVGKPKP